MADVFATLPAELVLLILEECESSKTLFNAISASPHCYRIFSLHTERVLSKLLKSLVPYQLVRDFTALNEALQLQSMARKRKALPDDSEVRGFLSRYFGADSFAFPSSKRHLVQALLLHTKISYFIDGLVAKPSHEMVMLCRPRAPGTPFYGYGDWLGWDTDTEEDTELDFSVSISALERTQIYRAFLRFELYCTFFHDGNGPGTERYSAQRQFDLFMSQMEPWEVDDMACVEQYLVSTIRAVFNELEADFEKPLKEAKTVKSNQASGSSIQKHMVDIDDLCDLSIFNQNKLLMFSDGFVVERNNYLSSMASAGMDLVFNLAKSDKTTRFHMIRTIRLPWKVSDCGPGLVTASSCGRCANSP